MALLTPAQWAKQQAGMPPEDRISYAEYVRVAGGTLEQLKTAEAAAATPAPVSISAAESAAAARAKTAAEKAAADAEAAKLAAENAYYTVKVGNTGKTQAQLDAEAGQAAAKTATEKAAADKAAALAAQAELGKTAAQKAAELKAKQDAEAKAAADKLAADAKASADALAKLQAQLKAAQDKAEADRIAAEKAIAEANTAKELADAKAALIKAQAEAARIAAEAKAAQDKAAADAKAAQEKADSDLKAAIAAGNAAAIAAAQKAAADATAASNAQAAAAATAAAEASAATAKASLNVSGNVVTPFVGTTAADIAAKAAADKVAADAALKESNRQSIITILQDRFAKYGMTGLANKIKELAIDGATEATITLGLQATDEYKTRFSANEERLKKGLTVLQPAEYLNLEDGYRQVLRSYGLTAFDNDAYVQQFISNDVSAAELSNRVVTAVQRVQNADPAISKQLRDYYGIGNADLVAYVLDPNQQMQKIERQVAASEIGVAGARQGLTVGVGVAEQLAAQGVSQAEAQKGYATIADILPTAEKLSAIYGNTTQKYGQSEAEQEVFNSLASAQRARQKLTSLETAQFSGQSGLARGGLTQQTSGNF
jgi:hypothetical protein